MTAPRPQVDPPTELLALDPDAFHHPDDPDDLLGFLGEPEPVRVPRPRTRGRAALTVVLLLLLAAVVGTGSYALTGWVRDGDVRTALERGQGSYLSVLAELQRASDVGTVVGAARRAPEAAAVVAGSAAGIDARTDAYGRAAGAQLRAEAGVLEAVGALAALDGSPLAAWGEGHAGLVEAFAVESATRRELVRHDPRAVRSLPEGRTVTARLAGVLAPGLSGDAAVQVRTVLGALAQTTTLAEVRELAEAVGPQRAAVEAAVDTLPDGPDRDGLSATRDALTALASLDGLTGTATDLWPSARTRLSDAVERVAAGSGAEAGGVRVALANALAAVDGVVARAAEAIGTWAAQVQAAEQARAAGAEELAGYVEAVEALAADRTRVDDALTALVARAEDPADALTVAEAVDALGLAALQHQALRDELQATPAPDAMQTAHDGLVAALDRALLAVTTAAEAAGLAAAGPAGCPECAYRDTPGAMALVSGRPGEVAAAEAAVQAWSARLAEVRSEQEAYEPPPPPDV